MMKRAVSWVVLLLVVWAVWHYGHNWSSPWAVIGSPVLSQLPKASNGCGEACK